VCHALAGNSGAQFSEVGFAALVKKSDGDESLAERLGLRLDIPFQLLRQLLARATDLLAWLPWAVPGILLSLATLWLILATPLRTVLLGSLSGIILAMVIKSSPISTQLFKASILQIATELPESAAMSGARSFTIYRRVLLPLIAPTAVTVGVLTALTASRDIATPALLYTDSTRPAAILMLEYGLNQEFERAAAMGVLLVVFAVAVTLGARRMGLKLGG
jgi:iron(III) transport system permease protein